jgi:predicted flap endonuclease-1-like 5' DNA nuclease
LTVADILELGASRKGREDLVEKTGVSSKLILKWVNMADLMRISGVGEEYSELLEAAGVDTVKELKMRTGHLHQAMLQVNEERKLVRRTPNLSEVRDWVEQAKQLEAVITY